MNHSATIFEKNRKALTENVMLQIHPSNDQERYKTCSRSFPLRKILQYDLTRNCLLFDEVGLERYKKHEIFKLLESNIKEQEYKLN